MQIATEIDIIAIKELINNMQKWFVDWFRGEVDQTSIHLYLDNLDEEWRLVNKQIPGNIVDKLRFERDWSQFHGSYKGKTFNQYVEFVSFHELSEAFFLVIYHEKTELENETRSRPMTCILKKLSDDTFKIIHVHE